MSDRLEEISIAIFRAQQLISLFRRNEELIEERNPDDLDAITSAACFFLDQAQNATQGVIKTAMALERSGNHS